MGIPETWLTRCQPWVPLGQSSLGLTEISLAVVGGPFEAALQDCSESASPTAIPRDQPGELPCS